MNQVLFDSTFITVVGVDVVVVFYPILPTSIFEARIKGVPLRGMMFNICDPPQEFDAKGESTRTTRLYDTLSVP